MKKLYKLTAPTIIFYYFTFIVTAAHAQIPLYTCPADLVQIQISLYKCNRILQLNYIYNLQDLLDELVQVKLENRKEKWNALSHMTHRAVMRQSYRVPLSSYAQ